MFAILFSSLLDLEPLTDLTFIAPKSPEQADRMFGGQYLAQCIAAATQSLNPDRSIHSLHGYFLRPGNSAAPTILKVQVVRDGRAFSHRQISVYQEEKELFRMIGSWSVAEQCPPYLSEAMPKVPDPDEVTYSYYQFCQDQMPDRDYLQTVRNRPMDILYINPPSIKTETATIEDQLMWIRIAGELPSITWKHQAALAYISDSTLIDHIAVPHGLRWMDSDFDGTSLDHAMWFHSPCVATNWVLFEQKVEWTGKGRGLAGGKLWSKEGELLATCGQEGLMRF